MAYGGINFNNTIFTGERDIKDGTIYSVGAGRERIKVGVDAEREQELIQTISEMQEPLDSYYHKLIEIRKYLIERYNDVDMVNQLSAFAPKKSPEEMAQEIASEQIRLVQEQAEQFRQQAEYQAQQFQEQSKKQIEVQTELIDIIGSLKNELKEMKSNGGNNGLSVEPSVEQVGGDSEKDRKVTGGSKASASTRKRNTSAKPKQS